MKEALLRHHLERAERGLAYNALAHCHAEGLHSVVLHDEPTNRVRMFLATGDHALHHNRGGAYSIAIHPHHCDVRLVGLYGRTINDVYALTPNPSGDFLEMDYRSAINDGEGALTPTGKRADAHLLYSQHLSMDPLLHAHQLHTIYLPVGQRAAWLVFEGRSDPLYQAKCWTNNPEPRLAGLYRPMSTEDVAVCLHEALRGVERPTA
jgi:hypothetical protein